VDSVALTLIARFAIVFATGVGLPGAFWMMNRAVSSVDTISAKIDALRDDSLETKGSLKLIQQTQSAQSRVLGKIAIANAKLAYQDYKRLFSGTRWDKLAAKGAKPQRLLWASTGTKNKDYSDVLYVEELIGPNTVPPATLDAFRDHDTPRDSLEENIEDARGVLAELETSG
jgi:transaldolase / glucose-6-phosphate isomerase